MSVTKVGTCCYCGTKAALVLRGKERHELSCGSCGAPLHALKILPQRQAPETSDKGISHRKPSTKKPKYQNDGPSRPSKRKKRKSFKRKVWSEVWDALEDIFD